MKNKYVDFITDEHLMNCIANLHKSYLEAKNDISKKKFYSNKIDTIKLTFDTRFNDLDEETLIEAEILRQIDKSINNAIGTFHEEVLGGIVGFEKGNLSGYDIKAQDNTLFADIKNKHNTMNSPASESLYQKLQRYADKYPNSKCYWVQILAKSSFNERWETSFEQGSRIYKNERVFKISGDQFYKMLSKQDDAFFQLYKSLPKAITDFLETIKKSKAIENSALTEISESAAKSKRTILDEITFENFSYYLGFDKL
jgi:translation elongation factor EF-G